MKWRLMTHKEMVSGYADDYPPVYPNHAYITNADISDDDPLYSIDICNRDNEDNNTSLAIMICDSLNSIEEKKLVAMYKYGEMNDDDREHDRDKVNEDDGILGK